MSLSDRSQDLSDPTKPPGAPPPETPSQTSATREDSVMSKAKPTLHIPRPKNAFIIFRQAKQQEVLSSSTTIIPNRDVSRELGRRWRNLSFDEKQHWLDLAEEEKRAHSLKYPDYKYQPRKTARAAGEGEEDTHEPDPKRLRENPSAPPLSKPYSYHPNSTPTEYYGFQSPSPNLPPGMFPGPRPPHHGPQPHIQGHSYPPPTHGAFYGFHPSHQPMYAYPSLGTAPYSHPESPYLGYYSLPRIAPIRSPPKPLYQLTRRIEPDNLDPRGRGPVTRTEPFQYPPYYRPSAGQTHPWHGEGEPGRDRYCERGVGSLRPPAVPQLLMVPEKPRQATPEGGKSPLGVTLTEAGKSTPAKNQSDALETPAPEGNTESSPPLEGSSKRDFSIRNLLT